MKTLYTGGKILTMSEPLSAQALVEEHGVVQAVGSQEGLELPGDDCRKVDLNGGTLLPAFIDPHSHFSQMASACLQVSLEGAVDVGEMKRRIQAFLQRQPESGGWISARDYDDTLPGGRRLTLEELDFLAPEHPLVIQHKSGHMGLMNTLALKELGITPETPAPEGGKIQVQEGELTGYLEENAFFHYLKKLPPPAPEQMLRAFHQAQEQYASFGIATVQDGMVVEEMLPLYRMLLDREVLKLDLVAYFAPEAYDRAMKEFGNLPTKARLKVGGIKIFLDGSPQGRTAWMRTPYAGEKEYRGYGTMSDAQVREAMEFAGARGTQLICHCNGDEAAEQFLRCLEQAEKKYPELARFRPVIIHGQLLGLDQLERVKKLGALVSFFPAHVYHWGDTHIRNFGLERASKISPARSALERGIPVTFHQDAPVIQPDMLETVWCAVNRVTRQGVRLGREEAVTPLQALEAVTSAAAYQYFWEGERGRLRPGMRADFVVLDRNPLETPAEELRNIQVLETWKDGARIFAREG